jgi:hypothetical protein
MGWRRPNVVLFDKVFIILYLRAHARTSFAKDSTAPFSDDACSDPELLSEVKTYASTYKAVM